MKALNSIQVKHYRANKKGPHVLISAGVHGDEFEPILAALELSAIVEDILEAGEVHIVPVVNTSAFAIGSRYGADGLDLARICPGNSSGSDSEKCAAFISDMIRRADYFIDMHTGGNLFNIFPLAGYMLHSSQEILEKQREMAEAFQLPVIWGTDSTPGGRTLSVARDANVPAIYVEYGGGGAAHDDITKAYINGCLNVLAGLGMTRQQNKIEEIKKYRVEDYRINSGHLQSQMPASADGIFVPAVRQGETIMKNQVWGTITNVATGEKNEIRATMKGIVLFLRVPAIVKKGDSLGGILPATQYDKKITITD